MAKSLSVSAHWKCGLREGADTDLFRNLQNARELNRFLRAHQKPACVSALSGSKKETNGGFNRAFSKMLLKKNGPRGIELLKEIKPSCEIGSRQRNFEIIRAAASDSEQQLRSSILSKINGQQDGWPFVIKQAMQSGLDSRVTLAFADLFIVLTQFDAVCTGIAGDAKKLVDSLWGWVQENKEAAGFKENK